MPLDRHLMRGNGPGLSVDEAEKLLNHVRRIEAINADIKDLQEDRTERKAIAKADGFDTNVIDAVIKRRAAGEGQTALADQLTYAYEEALAEQKELQDQAEKNAVHAIEQLARWVGRVKVWTLDEQLERQRDHIRAEFTEAERGPYAGPL